MFSPTLTSLAKELNARVCENRRYFRSILIFMLKRFRLHRKMRLSQLRIAIIFQRRSSWHSNAQRQVIPVAHLWFLVLKYVDFSQTSHGMVLFVELVREILKALRRRTSFSLVCTNVLHQVDKEVLCSMSVLKSGWMSTLGNLPVFTAVIKLSAFADAFVKQSDKQFWIEIWAKSWTLREQASFRNIEIMWIGSFCSSKWIVLAVVTTFFAPVLMWICATSPDMSIHNPRRNCHDPKHFMNKYSSATVVESTILLIFCLSYSIRLPYNIPSFDDRSRDSAENTVMPLLNGTVSGQNWSFTGCDLCCLASLLRAFISPTVGEAAFGSTSGKLVATLQLCSTL